jgi:hypothetical protein
MWQVPIIIMTYTTLCSAFLLPRPSCKVLRTQVRVVEWRGGVEAVSCFAVPLLVPLCLETYKVLIIMHILTK